MNTSRWIKLGVWGVAVATLLAASTIAERALANSSSFSWRMDKVHVRGKDNGRTHTLSAGALTVEGHIEITERMRASASSPLPIKFKIFRVEPEERVCEFTVVPDNAVGTRKAFSESCGSIREGAYWLEIIKDGASKPDGDAWHNRGTGVLKTQ